MTRFFLNNYPLIANLSILLVDYFLVQVISTDRNYFSKQSRGTLLNK